MYHIFIAQDATTELIDSLKAINYDLNFETLIIEQQPGDLCLLTRASNLIKEYSGELEITPEALIVKIPVQYLRAIEIYRD